MSVRVWMTDGKYTELRNEHSATSVWEAINRGEPIDRGYYGGTIIFNKANVTSVSEVRSSF